MIQVIDRAFNILEKISENPQRIWTVSELATLTKLKTTTCFHIVNSLVELAYIERIGMRKGYRLGPAVNRLCHVAAYRPDLIEAADSLLRDFVRVNQETILISVIKGTKRYVICQADSQHKLQVNYNSTVIEDIYYTSSGRLLLASCSEAQIEKFIAKAGLPPDGVWPEALSHEQLLEELHNIRNLPRLITKNPYLSQIAFPIFDAEKRVIAALGCFLPKTRFKDIHRDAILVDLQKISSALSSLSTSQST